MNRCAALSCLLLISQSSFGQEDDAGRVHGTGAATIQRLPETLRMQVAIIGKGATLKDAVTSLKTRTDAAKKQVTELGADKDSIRVDPPHIYEQQNNNQRRQMEMMMAQRMNRGGKKAAKNKVAPPVMVSAMLTASWKLKAKDAEDLLLTVHPLQEKIRTADLAGAKETEKLTPEQEELLEEAEAQGFSMYDGGEEAKPGEPLFLFVSRISDEDREQALADAFKNAKSDAVRLAKSAEATLGRLKSIQNNMYGGGYDGDDYGMANYNYNSRAYRALQAARNSQNRSGKEDNLEAIGGEPGMVKYVVNVTATFDLEPAKEK